MFTKKDRELLVSDLKKVFATKDDLDNKLEPIKKELTVIRKFFDGEYLRLAKRVKRTEEKLHIPPISDI